MYNYFDGTYGLLLIGAALTILASIKVKMTFNKYTHVRSKNGITGAEAAERILKVYGINDVAVTKVPGELTDNYNPSARCLNLSYKVYGMSSISAIAVAAHECGHAVQHHQDYAPMRFRTAIVPLANFGSKLGIPIIILGWSLGLGFRMSNGHFFSLATIGIWMFSLAILFQLVTLPVEFDASARALGLLKTEGILEEDEMKGARAVLFAAALTYVAAAASSILQLARLILLNGGKKGKR